MNLSTNFKRLRKEMNLEQKRIAKELKTNIETIRRIEQGKNKQINLELLEKIINFFNCSYDDLLKWGVKMNFAKNLKDLIEKDGKKAENLKKLMNALGLQEPRTIRNYMNGTREPSLDNLEKIKNALDCSYNDLLK